MQQPKLTALDFFAPGGPLTEAQQARADAAAAREAKVQRAACCSRAARTFFDKLLPGSAKPQVGRPSKERKLKREQYEMLKAAYIAAWEQEEATLPQVWFESKACRELCRSRGWEKLHADAEDAAGGAEPAQVGSGAEEEEEEMAGTVDTALRREYDTANVVLVSMYNVWAHKWAQDGSHCGWHTSAQLVEKVRELLNHRLAQSTAARYLAAEKLRYESNNGLRSMPNLEELIKAATR